MGTETLLPGAVIPAHRHLHQDEALFIHKGQGRAMVESEAVTVVPGMVVYAPRQSWHGLRNTGTGTLQFTWLSVPAGIEQFFRDLARAGSPDAAAIRDIAGRYGVEFRPAEEAPTPPAVGDGRRRRRGGRGRGPRPTGQDNRGRPASDSQGPPAERQPAPQLATAEPSVSPMARLPSRVPQPQGEGRRRHRRRGGRGRGPRPAGQDSRGGRGGPSPQAAAGAAEMKTGSAPGAAPAAARPASPRSAGGVAPAKSRDRRGHRRFGRVKEVYMGGQWVRVVGEGPVISGETRSDKPEEDAP